MATERGGWFSRADLLEAGYTDSEIRLRVRKGLWMRLCRDAYVEKASWRGGESPWERTGRLHELMARAVTHRMGGEVVISHQSATLLHRLPAWNLDHGRVQLTRSRGRARSDRTVQIHRSPLAPDDICQQAGHRLTVPARAVVETTCTSSYEVGVVLADAALRDGLVTTGQLVRMAKRLEHWPGSPAARAAAEFADGASESVGESRLRVLLANEGMPAPELQVEIRDSGGRLIGRVDFLVRQRLIVEFDGALKYESSKDLLAEKWREDRLRELGYSFARVGWTDLDSPRETGERLRRSLARATAP
ncbi:type IV toxin-antitoxin system AbiEi family antitoxin domain-containing protein [Kribbella sancticallisti]|uniref:type IV toxin-antitoxin system AbiEi family antitoxin domain-containing protein n=1 Tax=Kribbella sancticallisti TaxID=460087 RepID=UPI0031CEF12F